MQWLCSARGSGSRRTLVSSRAQNPLITQTRNRLGQPGGHQLAVGGDLGAGLALTGTQLRVVVGEPFGEARSAQARVRAGCDRGIGQFGAEIAGMFLAYDLARVVVGGK